ncbi:MuF-C-terminal domain-containing protein [Methylibium petroleiphilum]
MSDRTPPPGIEEVYGNLSAPGASLGLSAVDRKPPPGADELFGAIAPPKPAPASDERRGLLATVADAARGLLAREAPAAPEGSNVGNFRVPASVPTPTRPAGELLTQPNPEAQQPEAPAPLSREMAGRLKATLAAMKPEDRALAEQIPGWRGVAAQVLNRQIAAESQGAQRLEMPGASLESRTAYGVGQGMDAPTAASKASAELAAGLPGGPTAQLTAGRPSVLTPEEEAAARADGQGMQKRSTAARGFYGAQEGLAQGAAGVIAAALQAAGDKEGAAIYEKVGKAASVRAESANELKALQAKAAESGVTPSGPLTGAANYIEGMSAGAANSIGQMIPGIAVGLATGSGPAALAVMALPVFGQSYVEKRDAGGAPGASAAYAGLMAGFEVLGERYGVLPAALNAFKAKAKDVPLEELPKFLERGIVAMEKRGLLNKTAAGLVRTQAGEQFGEQLTSAGQYLLDGTALGLDKPVSVTGFLTNARDTAVQTLIATGVMQAGGVAAKKLTGAEGAQAAPGAAPAPAAPLEPVDLGSTKLSGAEVPVNESGQEKPQPAPAAVEAVANIEKLLGTPLDADAHEAATSPLNDRPEPTQAQKDAGNYKVGHIRVQGMDVSIENPRGSVRRGTSPDGTAWENTLAHHYGYLKGTKAIDGDQVDVFIGPNPDSPRAFVVDQVDDKGKFDEPKALIGFDSIEDAKAGYLANYAPGWTGLGAITELPIDAFKSWAKDGTKRKPLGDINGAKPDAGGPAGLADRPADGGGDQPAGSVEPVGELPAAGGLDGVPAAPEGTASGGEPAAPVGDGSGADAPLSREAVGQQFTALAEEFAASGRATGRTFQRVLAGYADNIADGSIKDAELPALAEKLAQYRRMLGEPEATPPAPPSVEPEVDTPTERTAGDVLQLDGKAWKITKASPRSITIKNEAGKVRTIAAGSPTWAKINDQNAPNAAPTAEAVAPAVEAAAPASGDAGTAGADPAARPARAQAARVTKPRKQQSAVRGSPALGAISTRLGGIDPSLLADLSSKVERSRVSKLGKKTAYTAWDNPPHAGKGPLFRAGGSKDLSLIAQMLEEEGFIPAGTYEADPVGAGQQAAEIIRAELRQGGSTLRAGSADDVETEMRRRMEAAMDRFEEHGISPEAVVESGYLDTTEAAQAAWDAAIEALADAESDVVDAFLQSVAEVEAQEERDAIQADSEADAEAGEGRGDAARAPEGGAGSRRRGPEDAAGGAPATAEGLTSPTPESLAADDRRAKDAAAADAREQKRLADKAKADAERGEFTLTGSDRPADVAAAAGQGDLLDAAEQRPASQKIDDVGEKIGGARKDIAESTGTRTRRSSEEDTRPAWARRFKVSQIVRAGGQINAPRDEGRWVISDSRSLDWMKQPRQVGRTTFATKEEAEAYIPIAAVGLKHRPVLTSSGKYEIWRDVTDRKRVKVVEQTFETRDDAMAYMAANAEKIIEANTTFGEADIPLPPDRARTGPERRTGDVKGEDFKRTFGFRGVEFGNWNNQDERQGLMNDAWDGLLDLADVLGVPPKALGLNGDLALAFGARGHGLNSARAHYERDRAVINLTKENGAGSLAHEWFHGLDHYFGRQDGKASATWDVQSDGTRTLKTGDREDDYVSHGFRRNLSGVRPEVREAYEALLQSMFKKAEAYVEDTAKADQFSGRAREELAKELDQLRAELSAKKDPAYYKRNNKPATAEQLAEFDTIAKAMVEGHATAIATEWRSIQRSKAAIAHRWTNDSLERLSAIYKEVRGRSGFDSTNRDGRFDRLRGYMERYSQRLKMLAEAQTGAEKQRMVPTDFAMNAKELDQGRGTDYWTTPHEMAARAFQGYVEDKIAERGGVSRFLNYAPENVGIPTPWGFKRPFPSGTERKAINAAFDRFVGALQTREDDAGNVALFQRTPPSFGESLDKVLDGTLPESAALKVSDSLPVLELLGMRRLPLATTGDRLTKMHFDHGLTRVQLKRLPELLASPVAVFESDTQPGALVAVLDLVKNGAPVVAAIKPNANLKRVDVNLLASAYPKDRVEQLGRWVDAGLLRYVDKSKTRGEATIGGVQFPWMVQLQRGSRSTVLGPQDLDKAAFSRAAGERGADPVRGAAQSYVDQITKDWANAPKVTVIDSMADAPEAVRRANESQLQQGADGEPAAFTYRGEVFIVAGQIKSMEGLAESLFHEALGHLGLRGLFGADLNKVLRQMAASMPDALKAKAKQYGLDVKIESQRLLAAEELLAEIAETRPTSTWVRKAITAIREWLRKHIPALADLKWSDAEIIERVIIPARRFIEEGRGQVAQASEPAMAFQRTGAAPARSAWRDATNRVQFAPGQWLYDVLGAAARPLLIKTGMKAASPELRRQIRAMRLEVQKAQETAVAVARETQKLTEDERLMVSDIIEKELAAGTIPPAHAVRLAALMNQTMGAQTGDLVRLGMLTQETAQRWDGAYLPRFYESKLRKQVGDAWADALRRILGRTSAMKGIKGKHLKGRGLFETIAASDLPAYEALGWEVRDPDYTPGSDDQVQVWRDYTRAERDDMGEIRDAGFRFVMGYMQTQRDIALGKMFEGMAGDPAISSRLPKQGWVQVPNTTVEGTGAKRYGKLGGRYVPEEVLSHLSQIEESQSAAWQMYRKAMSIWKEGKTVLNPVSHVNNILSNLTMAHFAGVGYHRADKYVAAIRDFATKSPTITEAKDAGLFLGTLSDAELMNTLPKELQDLAMQAESKTQRGAKFVYNAMTWFLRKPMGVAYQAEDVFFRYLIYKDARRRGVEPNDAVEYAQKFIFTYDDLPRGARFVRDFGVPFFAYTYKAVPALLHTALTHPVRFAAPAAVLWAANAMAYAIGAGDDDDSWDEILQRYLTDPEFRAKAREAEQLEREHLPPWMKGTTSLQTPKAIRMGMDEVTKLPLFLDVARIVPGGDLFDVTPNAGGLPLPQPITPSHPLFSIGVGMIGNKDLFFGKEITDSNDTRGEAATKRAEWLWKQVAPALAVGGGHWERGMNALAQASGGEIEWLPDAISEKYTGIGKDRLPVQPGLAALQTFGIKLRPLDLQKSAEIEGSMRTKMIRDIASEMRSLARLNGDGALSDAVFEREMEKARVKIDRLTEGLTVDGEAR